jgi:hypothetical protein
MECNSSTKLGQDIMSLKVDNHMVAHGYKTVSIIRDVVCVGQTLLGGYRTAQGQPLACTAVTRCECPQQERRPVTLGGQTPYVRSEWAEQRQPTDSQRHRQSGTRHRLDRQHAAAAVCPSSRWQCAQWEQRKSPISL